MSNFKDRRNFYVVTTTNEEFIKAKLILESYFKTNIVQGLTYYYSRILYIDKDGILDCKMLFSSIPSHTREFPLEKLLKDY